MDKRAALYVETSLEAAQCLAGKKISAQNREKVSEWRVEASAQLLKLTVKSLTLFCVQMKLLAPFL